MASKTKNQYTVIAFLDPRRFSDEEEHCGGWFFYARDQAEAREMWEKLRNKVVGGVQVDEQVDEVSDHWKFVCVLTGFVDYWRE